MDLMRRIAVLGGQCDEEYQKNFIEGFLEEAFKHEFEICVFSMYRKYLDTQIREVAESHIYELFEPEDYDAVVVLRDSIQVPGLGDALEERIHKNFSGPVLVVDIKSKYFPSILTDGFEPCYRLVSHLIEHHGYTDIAYLTGKRWHEHSIMRLEAYKKAMADHGLEVSEDRIMYGDFWYTSGEAAAEQLMASGRLPQAVACANDQMAIGLCKALEAGGINVGSDIAVIGFDSTEDGRCSPHPLTSCLLPARENGAYSAKYVDDMLSGRPVQKYQPRASIFIGESCGCGCDMLNKPEMVRKGMLRPVWDTDISAEGFDSVYNSMLNNLICEKNFIPFVNLVYSYVYQMGEDIEQFSLCLCEHWKDMETNPDVIPEEIGMSRHMIRVVNYGKDDGANYAGISEAFDRRYLLPELKNRGRKPRAYFFTPLYNEDKCFGYGVISYGDKIRSYDRIYREWMMLTSVGFEWLRRSQLIRLLENTQQTMKLHDNNRSGDILLLPEERQELDLVMKILDENLFIYHYQPIVDVNTASIYSYEALMRSGTETRISPFKIIKYAGIKGRLSDVEKATFLNVLDFVDKNIDFLQSRKIFINSIPGIRVDPETDKLIDEYFMKHPENVVVEFTEEAELADEELDRLNNRLGSLGVWTALDDYGTGYSNISNLLRYMPKIVKIDRSLLSGIQDKPDKKHFVKDIIDFCHHNGMLALAEGVENSAELQMVIFLGADLIQGFYTGRPSSQLIPDVSEDIKAEITEYVRERDEGTIRHSYRSGQTNRVILAGLTSGGYTDIVIGAENVVYKDISLIGAPGVDTDLFISIEDGYTGRLDFDNVSFTAVGRHQCMEVGENVNLTIVLKNDNRLRLGGIYVPESSRVIFEGEGNLKIELESSGFGIGAGFDEKCGNLIFNQDGEIHIISKGRQGVCIGSGKGGNIAVKRGKYILECNGSKSLGIGFFDADGKFDIRTCLLEIRLSSINCVGIGSMNGSVDFYAEHSTISITGGGIDTVSIGSFSGDIVRISAQKVYFESSIRSDRALFMGSVEGRSEVALDSCRLGLSISGERALPFGNVDGNQHVELMKCDMSVIVNNEYGCMVFGKDEDFVMDTAMGGKPNIIFCGNPVETFLISQKDDKL